MFLTVRPSSYRARAASRCASREVQREDELLPPCLEGDEIRLAQDTLQRLDAARILDAVRAKLAVEAHQEATLLEVMAEIPRRGVVGARIPVVERVRVLA